MQEYVRASIRLLNDITVDLDNLNNLSMYLSKQTDINALKVLKLIVLASETNRLIKPFDINYSSKYVYFSEPLTKREYKINQSIVGNLSLNPQNIALDLMDYIVKNYYVDLSFECYGIYSIIENWLRSFLRMDYDDMDMFYKRYDMLDKKIDMLEFMIFNGLLKEEQIKCLLNTYKKCLNKKNVFSKEQLHKMEYMIYIISQFSDKRNVIHIRQKSKEVIENDEINDVICVRKTPNFSIYERCKQNAELKLQNYIMQNDQCVYIVGPLENMIKSKTIR